MARRAFLHREGVLKNVTERIDDKVLATLNRRDMEAAVKSVAQRLGKEFTRAPRSGRISGKYVERLYRPGGRYAVIERPKDFSLVPSREVMDLNLGKQISGAVQGNRILWTLGKNRGIDRI